MDALSRELYGSHCWGRPSDNRTGPSSTAPVDDDLTCARRRRDLEDADAAYEARRRAEAAG